MEGWKVVYLYGSHVYGTADEDSDRDYIIISGVVEPELDGEQISFPNLGIDHTLYSGETFQKLLDDHDVSALECFFSTPLLTAGSCPEFRFELDLSKLRRSFSAKASNSWVKAKKKIDVHKEYRLGRKSLFHALRILDFGIQIADEGRISNYSSFNHAWDLIKDQNFETWKEYKDAWQGVYNSLRSSFRILAPKE